MTLKTYLIIMSGATAMCWLAFGMILWSINPEITSWIGFSLFYISLFLCVMGTSAIIGFLVRFVGLKKELAFRSVRAAFRQSFLFALLIVITLFLLSKDLFTWLNLFLLVLALSVLEFFLISYEKPHETHHGEKSALDNEDYVNVYNE